MTKPVIIGTNVKFVVDANTKMISLFANASTASSPLSYLYSTGSAYQVPVGKSFYPIRVHGANSATTGNNPFKLWYNGTVDSLAGANELARFRNTEQGIINFEMGGPEIPAGNYITLENSTAGNVYSTMMGVETDA